MSVYQGPMEPLEYDDEPEAESCPLAREVVRACRKVMAVRHVDSIEYAIATRDAREAAEIIRSGADLTDEERDEWMADIDCLLPRPDAIDEFIAACALSCIEARS